MAVAPVAGSAGVPGRGGANIVVRAFLVVPQHIVTKYFQRLSAEMVHEKVLGFSLSFGKRIPNGDKLSNGEKCQVAEDVYIDNESETCQWFDEQGNRLIERDPDTNKSREDHESRIKDLMSDVVADALMMRMRSAPLARRPRPDGTGNQDPRYRRLSGAATLADSSYRCFQEFPNEDNVKYVLRTGFPKVVKCNDQTRDDVMMWGNSEGDNYTNVLTYSTTESFQERMKPPSTGRTTSSTS